MKNRFECIGIIVFIYNASQKTLSGMLIGQIDHLFTSDGSVTDSFPKMV
jgi:hypothetical protein